MFEITSTWYRWFLWASLLIVLATDLGFIAYLYLSDQALRFPFNIAFIVGFFLKLGILWVLRFKQGPLEILVRIWGGLFVLGGVTGLLSFLVSDRSIPAIDDIAKLVQIVLGIALIVPLSRCVQR